MEFRKQSPQTLLVRMEIRIIFIEKAIMEPQKSEVVMTQCLPLGLHKGRKRHLLRTLRIVRALCIRASAMSRDVSPLIEEWVRKCREGR